MSNRSPDAEVLLFTSPHCSQCRAVRPTATEVAASFPRSVRFREIDTSTDPHSTQMHRVRGVPTLVALNDDVELGRSVGARSRSDIVEMFESARAGETTRQTISRTDRTLRLFVAAAFGIAAVAASVPLLWILAAGAATFGIWDLIRP